MSSHIDRCFAAALVAEVAATTAEKSQKPRPVEQGALADARRVLRSFNTWTFKREQPSDPQLMLRVLEKSLAAQRPISFVLYWGKGPRHTAAWPEAQCLDFLAALAGRVQSTYARGAAITLILTDTHAELNGHSPRDIKRYFDDIRLEAQRRGFETRLLSALVRSAANLTSETPVNNVASPKVLASLTASASKWYRGTATPEEGALAYLRMNLIEQQVVERVFPNSIFITFNGSQLRLLFPRRLPIFYMYSLRRGTSVKPWFLPAEPIAIRLAGQSSILADS